MTQFQPSIMATRCRPPALVRVFLGGMILGAWGCSSPPPATPDRLASATSAQTPTRLVPVASSPTRPSGALEAIRAQGVAHVFGYTYQRPDGNRLVMGRGTLPQVAPVDLRLAGGPLWVVAAPLEGGSVWAAVLEDGRVQGFHVAGRTVEAMTIEPGQLPTSMPPLLKIEGGVPSLLVAPSPAASPLSHPVVLNDAGRLAFIEEGGDLVVWEDGEMTRLALNALPDARLLLDEARRLLLLTGATARYAHGVLGDRLEAATVTLVETEPMPRVVLTIALPEPQVVEGVAPIWADLDGDGGREIVVTVSDADQGAQVVVFDETGERIAAGPAVGRGQRWRHQLAVAPFGPHGEMELVDVLTPHIGGIVEFYRMTGMALNLVAQVRGFSSHVIGSRNLDMAVAGDWDGDGQVELLLPSQERTELGSIRRTAGGAGGAWTVSVGGRVSTNLAAVTRSDGGLEVGVGREDKVLRLWLP